MLSHCAFYQNDVMSSGNSIDLLKGERVIVVATGVNWYKIIYMNAEYYMLGYLELDLRLLPTILTRRSWITRDILRQERLRP